MVTRIAINGFGRIGRNILRALFTQPDRLADMQIVAINDMSSAETLMHLLKYDSVHGPSKFDLGLESGNLIINGYKIMLLSERDPKKLPWDSLKVDVVHECTGCFASREKAAQHLVAGAKKVLISAPAGKDVDATIVYGVNHNSLRPEHKVISNASCTTNCLAPIVAPLHAEFGLVSGLMTTIHAYTGDQRLVDTVHTDLRRARAAGLSMIPTNTGAASSIGLVIPDLAGKLDGYAMRVPTANVSVVDLSFQAESKVDVAAVNSCLERAARGELSTVLKVNKDPLVSIDFNQCPASAIFDATQTRVIGQIVKVLAWYDNEWGFSNRMLDTTKVLHHAGYEVAAC